MTRRVVPRGGARLRVLLALLVLALAIALANLAGRRIGGTLPAGPQVDPASLRGGE